MTRLDKTDLVLKTKLKNDTEWDIEENLEVFWFGTKKTFGHFLLSLLLISFLLSFS